MKHLFSLIFLLTLGVNTFSQTLTKPVKYIEQRQCRCVCDCAEGLQDVITNNDTLTTANTIHCEYNDYAMENLGYYFIQGNGLEHYSQQSTRSGQTYVNSEMFRGRVFDSANQSSATHDAINDNGVFRSYMRTQDNANNYTQIECRTDSVYIVTPLVSQSSVAPDLFLKLISTTGAVEYSSLPKGTAVADAVDESDVVTQFNALLASLRAAGYIEP